MNKMLTFEENKINNGDYLLINYDDDEDDWLTKLYIYIQFNKNVNDIFI